METFSSHYLSHIVAFFPSYFSRYGKLVPSDVSLLSHYGSSGECLRLALLLYVVVRVEKPQVSFSSEVWVALISLLKNGFRFELLLMISSPYFSHWLSLIIMEIIPEFESIPPLSVWILISSLWLKFPVWQQTSKFLHHGLHFGAFCHFDLTWASFCPHG